MKTQNSTLAMLGLVLRIYRQEKRGAVLLRCARDTQYTDLSLDASMVCTLMQDAGLSCMSLRVREGDIPVSLQDFANDRHLVMVGLKPSPLTPGQEWAVLEVGHSNDLGLIIFGNSPDSIHVPGPVRDVLTGEYIVVADQVDRRDFRTIRDAMDG